MIKKTVAIAALSVGLMGTAHAGFVDSGFESEGANWKTDGIGWDATGTVDVVSSYTFGTETILAPQGSKMAVLGGNVSVNFIQSLAQGATTETLRLWYRVLGDGGDRTTLTGKFALDSQVGMTTFFNQAFSGAFDSTWLYEDLIAGTTSVSFLQVSSLGNARVLLDVQTIPEPATYGLLLGALGIMGAVMRRRSRDGRA